MRGDNRIEVDAETNVRKDQQACDPDFHPLIHLPPCKQFRVVSCLADFFASFGTEN